MRTKQIDGACLVAVALISAAAVYLAVVQAVRHYRRLQAESAAIVSRIAQLGQMRAAVEQAQARLDARRAELRDLSARMAESWKIGEFLENLDVLVRDRRLALTSVSPQASVRDEFGTRTPVDIAVTGSFTNLYLLLHDLETMDRVVQIEKMALVGIQEGRSRRMDLTVSLFER